MTTLLTLKDTVGDWAVNHPATSRVFEKRKIDYCCGGGKSLEQACQDSQVEPKELLAELAESKPRITTIYAKSCRGLLNLSRR